MCAKSSRYFNFCPNKCYLNNYAAWLVSCLLTFLINLDIILSKISTHRFCVKTFNVIKYHNKKILFKYLQLVKHHNTKIFLEVPSTTARIIITANSN